MLTAAQAARWAQIKADFLRNKAMGGDDADVGGRMVAQLADIAGGLQALGREPARPVEVPSPQAAAWQPAPWDEILSLLEKVAMQRAEADRASLAATDVPVEPTRDSAHVEELIDALRASHEQQGRFAAAVLHLAGALRAGLRQPPLPGKGPHVPTPDERRLDEALAELASEIAATPSP